MLLFAKTAIIAELRRHPLFSVCRLLSYQKRSFAALKYKGEISHPT